MCQREIYSYDKCFSSRDHFERSDLLLCYVRIAQYCQRVFTDAKSDRTISRYVVLEIQLHV